MTPTSVDGAQAVRMVAEGAQLVDVREKDEWNSGHAAVAVHIPLGTIATAGPRRLKKNAPVVAVCASGMRSKQAASVLREAGYSVANLKGGMGSWVRAGGKMA